MSACNPNKINMYIDTIFLFNVFLFVVVVFTVLITCFHWDPLLTRLCSGYKPKSYKEKKKNTNAKNQHERLSCSYYGGKSWNTKALAKHLSIIEIAQNEITQPTIFIGNQ